MKFLSSEKLSEHKYKTPEGYLICTDAILARTGKQTYRRSEVFADFQDDSEIEIDRKPEEVFSAQTLASFENKPITVEHPDTDVNAENHNQLSVGFVRDVRKATIDGQDVMLGNLVITDAKTIEEIEDGEHTDLSCGYDCDIIDEANPQQRNIRGNHVALCQQGRAGIARIVDSVKDNMTTKEFEYWSYHAIHRPNDRNKLNRIIDLFYRNGYELFDWADADFDDKFSNAYENASSSLKNQINAIIKDSVKDAQEYKINYYNSYTGRHDVDYITANNVKEAIKRFRNDVVLRGDGTANINVISISPNDGYMRLYGKLSELLKSKDLNDSTKDATKNIAEIANYFKIWGKPSSSELQEVVDFYKLKKDEMKQIFGNHYDEEDLRKLHYYDSIKDNLNVDIEKVINIAKSRAFELTRQSKNYLTFRYKGNDRNKDVSEIAKILPNNMSVSWDEDSLEIAIRDVVKDDLVQSSSKEAFKKNVKTEIESGKDPKQAVAIAYSVQRKNDSTNDDIEEIPGRARKEMNESNNKAATLIGILSELQQEVDKASDVQKAEIKEKAEKILNDLKRQFNLENEKHIKLDSKDKTFEISYTKDSINYINVVKAKSLEDAISKMKED